MALGCPSFALTPSWHKEQLLLVRTTDAIRLCRDGGFQELPRHQAEVFLTTAAMRDQTEVRDFIQGARVASVSLSELDDLQVVALLRTLLASADLRVVRESAEGTLGDNASLAQQRKLVRAIESKLRAGLTHEGRRYKLVADTDLRRIPDRDSYEVAGHDEAIRVLDGVAKQADPLLVSQLAEARGRLARDWRPPLSPDGLVLLRRLAQQIAPGTQPEPALTPSQLKKLHEPEWDVAPGAQYDDAPEITMLAEREAPFELETGAEVEAPAAEPADGEDEMAA